jgi:hypothetical protein
MSDRDSSDVVNVVTENPSELGTRGFTRWPGLLSLTLGWTLGPVVALLNQQLTYQANMWACGRNQRGVVHIVPALCLIVVIGMAVTSYRDWKAVGAGVEDEAADVPSRSRFLAIGGVIISIFCALVIIAQWAAVFVFAPCMRA